MLVLVELTTLYGMWLWPAKRTKEPVLGSEKPDTELTLIVVVSLA